MECFVYKYKNMVIGTKEEDLDFNMKDVAVEKSSPEFQVVGVLLIFEADERRVRPPPEPPPWPQVRGTIRVFWLNQKSLIFCFVCGFRDCYFCFVVCFFLCVPVCKTLILEVDDERNMVTVYGFKFPTFVSA
ncbi:unnamed protein product, partial [Cuscuta europaea]